MLELHDIISQIKKFRPSLFDFEVFNLVIRGSQEVQNALGGLRHPKLAHLFRAEVKAALTTTSPSVVLPSDAGIILRAEINDVPVDVLPSEQESAVRRNWLYKDSAIRRGNEVTFYNLTAPKVGEPQSIQARIVYETTFEAPVFVDGFYGKIIDFPYKGKTVVQVVFPDGQQFPDGYLRGASLRFYDSNKSARDWSVFHNFWKHPNDDQDPNPSQRIVLNDDLNSVSANYPNFALYKETGYPIRLTRLSLPPVLREAIVLWAQYSISGEPRHRQDFFAFLDQYRGNS